MCLALSEQLEKKYRNILGKATTHCILKNQNLKKSVIMLWLVLYLKGEKNQEFTLDCHLALIMMIRVWRETY